MNNFTLNKKAIAMMVAALVAGSSSMYAESTITLIENFMYAEGMSDNGRYVTGYNGEEGWVYDAETGEVTTLDLGGGMGLEVKDVSNDGVVVGTVGSATGQDAAVWTNGVIDTSTFADINIDSDYVLRVINCISGDGTIIAGHVSSGWDATAYILKNGETIELPMPALDPDGLAYVQAVPMGITPDNRYIACRLCNEYGQYRVGLWDLENLNECQVITLAEPVLDWDGVTYYNPSVQAVSITPNGKIIANNDDDGSKYAYDIATTTATTIDSPSADFAVNAFGDNYVTISPAWGLMRTGYIVTPEGEQLMQDYFLNTYGVDIIGAGVDDTGTLTCISADETAFAGMTYYSYFDEDLQWDSYNFLAYHIKVDNSGSSVNLAETISNKPVVVANDGVININGVNGKATVNIVDIAGRTHVAAAINGNGEYNVANGTYIVNVKQGNSRYIYKVIVK